MQIKNLIFTGVVLVLVAVIGVQVYEDRQMEIRAWDSMCQILLDKGVAYQCGDVARPPVRYVEMFNAGRYMGDKIVEVNLTLRGAEQESVLVHEFVHYLHKALGQVNIPGWPREICWSENVAHHVQGVFDGYYDPYWWIDYRYCWEFYGTKNLSLPQLMGQ